MNFLIYLIVGGIAGWLASIMMKRDGQQGIILNVIVGIIGGFLGSLVGFVRGRTETIIMSLIDVILAFPALVLLLVLSQLPILLLIKHNQQMQKFFLFV